jgi:hypothetical protein
VDISISSWFLILLAVLAANLPFVNERLFVFIPISFLSVKPIWLRLIELIVLYTLIGGAANLIESRIGNVYVQRGEFYVVTLFLFAVFSYPGFVYRYLRKRRS